MKKPPQPLLLPCFYYSSSVRDFLEKGACDPKHVYYLPADRIMYCREEDGATVLRGHSSAESTREWYVPMPLEKFAVFMQRHGYAMPGLREMVDSVADAPKKTARPSAHFKPVL
jgi:hypothetical protein